MKWKRYHDGYKDLSISDSQPTLTTTTEGIMPHGEHKIVGGENNSFEANEIYVKTSALTLLGQVI